jgi:hypothetical protein
MKDHRKEAEEKLAEIYQQMVAHAGEKKLIMSDIHLEAYLHAAFNSPETPTRECRWGGVRLSSNN